MDVLDGAAGGIGERGVVAGGGRAPRPHVRDDVGDVGVREEPAHGIDVELIEVGRVELLVVGPEELVGDALAEPADQHLAERLRRAFAGGPEVELDQALEELVVRQLVDVGLEREVDVAAGVADRGTAEDGADVLARHPRAQPGLDRGVLEVEEVAGVVPHEAVLHHRAAVAAGLGGGFQHEYLDAGVPRAPPVRKAQAGHAGPDDDGVDDVDGGSGRGLRGGVRGHDSLAISFLRIRWAIAAAAP